MTDELNSDGDCSLREAIVSANTDQAVDACAAGSGNDEVGFDASVVPGIFAISIDGQAEDEAATGDLDIVGNLVISGPSADEVIIDGGRLDRVFHVLGASNVGLSGLTVRNGEIPPVSSARDLGVGGGLRNTYGGVVTIAHCRFTENSAGFNGGAVSNEGLGKITISRSTFDNNYADHVGAGLSISGGGVVQISDSTFADNFAIAEGGAIRNDGGATLTITNSTFADNAARNGGAFGNAIGIADVKNSTFSGNRSTHSGGAIWTTAAFAETRLQNTILAHNVSPEGADCSGATTSLGGNLIGDPEGCGMALQPSDMTGDPGLGAFTMAAVPGGGHFPLLEGSQAIDAGHDLACPRADQLGNGRADGDGDGLVVCDTGAIEFGSGCRDLDNDGYGRPGSIACRNGESDDCDDTDPDSHIGAAEICDGNDNNCDGLIPGHELDQDRDGVLTCEGDCDDASALTHPGAAEIFDGEDNDCDFAIDETLDLDGDGIPFFNDRCRDSPQGACVGPDGCSPTLDVDNDGEVNFTDVCPATPDGVAVDQAGCSLDEFCAAIDVSTALGATRCLAADWLNDEPLMSSSEQDCEIRYSGRRRQASGNESDPTGPHHSAAGTRWRQMRCVAKHDR